MKTLRFCLAAAVLSAVVAACGDGSPTASARDPLRRAVVAGDTTPKLPGPTTAPPGPIDPPPPGGDGRQIIGSGS